jgi:dihydrofolate reductase
VGPSTTGEDVDEEDDVELTVHVFTTIDGVMQGPGGPDEDRSGGFALGGWMAPYTDAGWGEVVEGWFQRTDEILLGRTTYEMLAGYWPQVTAPDDGVASALNERPKHVVSRTLRTADWGNTSIIGTDLEAAVRSLKDRDGGELQVHGSWQLVRSLQALDLVDEYRVLTFPVVLGAGKRLFGDGVGPIGMEADGARDVGGGVVSTVHRPTSAPATGRFAVEDGAEVVRFD